MIPYKIIYGIIFLPVIFYLGIVTSLEDILTSKIKNKWILVGLIYSGMVYFLAWILYALSPKLMFAHTGMVAAYLIWMFDKWCINLLVSTLVAYLLWHFKLWAAGDAKLFICYSSLIPMGQYSKVYFNYYFASFLLLLTIFIPATLFLFLRSTVFFIKKFNFSEIRKKFPKLIKEKLIKFNKKEAGRILLGFFVFFLFFRTLREEITNLISKFLPNQNILVLISLLAFKPLSKFFKKKTKIMGISFLLLVICLTFKMRYSLGQFILEIRKAFTRAISIMILLPIFKKTIDLYSERTQKTTPFAIWMFLGALITWFL